MGVERRAAARCGAESRGVVRLGIQPGPPRYFLLRLTRHGPLVPGRLRFIDHEPGVETNKRDRWPPLIPEVIVAGEIVEPEILLERFSWLPPHWKSLQSISGAEYEYRFKRLRWAERNAPSDPTLRPRRRVSADQMPLPSFDRENAI